MSLAKSTTAIVDLINITTRLISKVEPGLALQGGFDPSNFNRPGVKFGLLVRSLLGLNKRGALKPSLIMS